MSVVSLAGSTALEAALGGMHRASNDLNVAANQIVDSTIGSLSGGSGGSSTTDTVALSEVAQRVRGENSLEGALVDASSAGLVYTANAQVVNALDETQESLFHIVA